MCSMIFLPEIREIKKSSHLNYSRAGTLAAHEKIRLLLLPSGPDRVHGFSLHETRSDCRSGGMNLWYYITQIKNFQSSFGHQWRESIYRARRVDRSAVMVTDLS